MSLLKLIGKKAVTKSAVVRGKIAKRLKEAIRLIVARGAHVAKNEQGKERLEFDQSDVGGDKWVLSNWTYVVQPTLEVYLMPYYTLIPNLRRALKEIKVKGDALERQWAAKPKVHASSSVSNVISSPNKSVRSSPTRKHGTSATSLEKPNMKHLQDTRPRLPSDRRRQVKENRNALSNSNKSSSTSPRRSSQVSEQEQHAADQKGNESTKQASETVLPGGSRSSLRSTVAPQLFSGKPIISRP